jgi:spermidine/putrescine transport system substrate-binding protein
MNLRPIASVLTVLFAACQGGPTSEPAPVPEPPAQRSVTVYMYSDYIDPELLTAFEQTTGIDLRLDVYETTEDMMAKLKQSPGQYDVVVVSDHAIPLLARTGALAPLDKAKIRNLGNLDARFLNPPYDPGNAWSLPYQWGTMGLMYRKDRVPALEPTWGVVLEAARQPGPLVLIDSMRDMMAAALIYQGRSVNSHDPAELKAAGDAILAAKTDKVVGFEGGVGGVKRVLAGDATLAIVYNGDAIREPDPNVDFVIPREGTIIWMDAMTLVAGSSHQDEAYAFIDYILDAEVGAALSNWNRYPTPNAASLPSITPEDRANPIIYPPDEVVAKMEYLADVGEDTRLYDEIWTGIKAR